MSSTQNQFNLIMLVLARVCTTTVFMVYPACLNVLREQWNMTATQAGIIQGGFTLSMAVSLLLTSVLCDRFGAKKVFIVATQLSAIAAFLAFFFARDYISGITTISLIGLTQGGTYTPAIMLASHNARPNYKNTAVGWVLAGMSAGYVLSLVISSFMIVNYHYKYAFLAVAILSVLGAFLSYYAVKNSKDTQPEDAATREKLNPYQRKNSRLLIIGYIGHTWELLGMWAWTPAFLIFALGSESGLSGVQIGVITALALHMSGFFSSFLSGIAADRFGVRNVLIGFATLGFVCSLIAGWSANQSPLILVLLVAIYGFAAIGDSAVLSSAMTDAVPPSHLGRALGIRSVLGIGAGAISPIGFGFLLDLFSPDIGWGLGYMSLAIGGGVALLCAIMLGKTHPSK